MPMSDCAIERLPFPGEKVGAEVEAALTEFIQETVDARIHEIIPAENSQAVVHGVGWVHQREDRVPSVGGLVSHRADAAMRYQDLACNNLAALPRFVGEIVEAMYGSVMRNLYATVGDAAEDAGNVIVAEGQPFTPDLFLELLRKVEFGVDREGHVTLPQLHLHPDIAKHVIPLLQQQGAEFKTKVDEITAEKGKQAVEREQARLERFRQQKEDQ